MLCDVRRLMRDATLGPETMALKRLVALAALDDADRQAISERAAGLIRDVRASSDPGMMESFLAEYGLSTKEGVALMCLAEALLRVPDDETIDDLIQDKIAPHDWGAHVGDSGSVMVNASTWALMLTGRVLDGEEGDGVVGVLRGMVRRLGDPHRGGARDARDGRAVRPGARHSRGHARGPCHGKTRLHLFLRHAGRGRPDRR